jgi:cytochrome P450
MDIFSDENRVDPFPLYACLRNETLLFKVPPPFDAWMVLDYQGVKRVLNDHESFSSEVPSPDNWFIFKDPPKHTRLRFPIAKAFTACTVAQLESLIRKLSDSLIDQVIDRGEMDIVDDFAVPLAVNVIAEIMGIPKTDWRRFRAWSDVILKLSYSRGGNEEARDIVTEFGKVTAAMSDYITEVIAGRRLSPGDDLLSRLLAAEVGGPNLTHHEIVGFYQLMIVAGQETSANLISNTILCLLENPSQFALLKGKMQLLPSAIEETLRYRSPVQWVMRTPRREIQLHGRNLSPGQLVLAVIGSANHDPEQFARPEEFDIVRHPNPHLAFGGGIHFCMGAALSRMEASIALSSLFDRITDLKRVDDRRWEPRKALHVHGPTHLHLRFRPIHEKALRDQTRCDASAVRREVL